MIDIEESGFLAKIANAFSGFLITNRILLLIITSLITVFMGYRAAQINLSPGFDKSIPFTHPYMEVFNKYRGMFGGENRITIFIRDESGNMFNPAWFKVMDNVTQDVLVMENVDARTVTSIFTPNVNFVAVTEEGFTGSRIVDPSFTGTEADIANVKENLFKSAEIGKTVAADFSGALVIADLIEKDPATGKKVDYAEFAERLNKLKKKYENERIQIHVIGFAPFVGHVIAGIKDVIAFFGITLVITFALLLYFSGSWKLASISIFVSMIAVVWQLGAVEMLGYGLDPMSILVPFLILAIGVSHAVQMTQAWRNNIADGADSILAAHTSVKQLLIPGATAILVDAVGFAVITLIPIETIRELGIAASLGVGIMLATNKIMLPILLSWVTFTDREKQRAIESQKGKDHPIWLFLSSIAKPKYASVIVIVAIGMGVAGYIAEHKLVVGDSEAGAPEFWPNHIYNKDIKSFDKRFSVGLDQIVVLAQSDVHEACVDYSVMKTIDDFVWSIQNMPDVRAVSALSTVIRERNIGNFEANPKFLGLPFNKEMIGANIYRIEASEGLFSNDCKTLPIRIDLTNHRAETLTKVISRVKDFESSHGNPNVHFLIGMGNASIMAATNESVTEAQLEINLALFTAVGLFVFLTFFSWRATLCAMIPLILVAYFANVVMVALNIGLKIFVLPVLALGVGVGVDYSIYLLSRMMGRLKNGMKVQEAYFLSLKEVGVPVIITSVTMSLGVATWLWSSLKFQADMGVLLAYMFFVNMLGAIFLMPAVATMLFRSQGKKDEN